MMKLTAKLLLQPTQEQCSVLLNTLQETNAACDEISRYAFEHKTFSKFKIQKAIYYTIKESFNLSAQVVVRAIGKVADAYKLDKDVQRTFKSLGAIAYDARILRYYSDQRMVSIWTTQGREKIPYICNEHVSKLMQYQQGESDLAYSKGRFFLLATCDVPQEAEEEFEDVLGVDLGIINLATDSDGNTHAGKAVDEKRNWFENRRATLQSVGTKSAKRRLKQLSKKEKLYKRDVNHCLSKQLVAKAKYTNRAIALEDLSGIRKRIKVRKTQRSRHSKWAFYQLRSFIEYKSALQGVKVILADPRNTSRTCSKCGHCEKKNRKSQSEFVCQKCTHSMSADINAAINISRVAFNRPMVATNAIAATRLASA